MLKTKFKDQLEFDIYLAEQKVRQEKGYLTFSERETIKQMQDKNYKPTFIKEMSQKLPIVSDINQLRKPCQEVTKDDNIKELIQKLKDTLACYSGLGISGNQIGIQKKISYIKIPKIVNKKIEYKEYIIINAKIIEKDRPIKVKDEGCLSFPGIGVTTKRYIFITFQYLDENLKPQMGIMQDLESLVVQHEIDHQNGFTLFQRKWVA